MFEHPSLTPRPSSAVFVFEVMPSTLDGTQGERLALRVEAATSVGASTIVLDFSAVRSLTGAGIARLSAMAEATDPGCTIVAAALSPEALALAHASCLQDALPMYSSVAAALAALAR